MRRGAALYAIAALIACATSSCSAFDPQTGDVLVLDCKDTDSDPSHAVSFKDDLRPIMDRLPYDPAGPGCKQCHYQSGELKLGIMQGRLDMSSLGLLRKGGITSGANIAIPGRPCESAIVQKLIGIYDPAPTQMPKVGSRYWNAQEVQLMIDWIAEGALGADDE